MMHASLTIPAAAELLRICDRGVDRMITATVLRLDLTADVRSVTHASVCQLLGVRRLMHPEYGALWMYTAKEMAEELIITETLLMEWRNKTKPVGPPAVAIGGNQIRYRSWDLWEWNETLQIKPSIYRFVPPRRLNMTA